MSPQLGFLCEVNPALGTLRAIHLSISQNSHRAPSSRGRYVLAICGFIPMPQQIKLHQQDRRHPCTGKTKKDPDHASLSREWDCGIEEKLLQSRNVKSSRRVELLRERSWDITAQLRCQRQHRRLNLVSPITGVPTHESAFKLETFFNCVFLSKDGELRTKCRDVQFGYFLIELLQEEVDLVLLGCSSMTDVPEQRR